ncbi:helix-turn-helix domain-containing protein [Stenotrophomonas maltophilia]|nr:helix-turn-helix domain-containing protein [Stenotrophomonas maltophilia]
MAGSPLQGRCIDQIASQVGYSDGSSFARVFRERTRMSPEAYRSRYSSG